MKTRRLSSIMILDRFLHSFLVDWHWNVPDIICSLTSLARSRFSFSSLPTSYLSAASFFYSRTARRNVLSSRHSLITKPESSDNKPTQSTRSSQQYLLCILIKIIITLNSEITCIRHAQRQTRQTRLDSVYLSSNETIKKWKKNPFLFELWKGRKATHFQEERHNRTDVGGNAQQDLFVDKLTATLDLKVVIQHSRTIDVPVMLYISKPAILTFPN